MYWSDDDGTEHRPESAHPSRVRRAGVCLHAYSNFKVGAALLAKNGSVYTGCNIECASFTPTNCAERTALFKAVSEGVHEFAAVAVVGAKDSAPDDALVTSPCGVCRQMLYEFGGPDLRVIMAKSENDWREMTLGELLPLGFGPEKVL